jgi:maltoporin
MPVVVYQAQHDVNGVLGTNMWFSACARPVFFFTEHLSLAIEGGLDWTKSGTGQYEGWLRKITVAPQIGAGRKFVSGPVLRAFITCANWFERLKDYVQGIAYENSKDWADLRLREETWW